MSTYTDLHTRTKENITILRMPGNKYDGIKDELTLGTYINIKLGL